MSQFMNKKNLIVISIIVALVAGWGISSMLDQQASDKSASHKETALEHAAKHAEEKKKDPNYVCPMHPQIVRGEPGTCPICGMDLVKVEEESESAKQEKKILYWVAPMDPSYRRDGPGKSPMGMDLVPVYDEGDGISVKISPAVVNNMGVRTAIAEVGKLWRKIDTVGYIDYDETMLSHVHLRTDGWIEKLYTKSEGDRVKQGEKLFEFYSPTIVNAMEEFLQSISTGNKGLIRAGKDRLQSLGVSASQTEQLIKTKRVPQTTIVYATQDGVISNLKVREGMYVKPGTEVMSLADLSSVWVVGEVFERQADWVKAGQYADVALDFVPGRVWEGKVEYVYPTLDPKTRTLKVRMRFDNKDEQLKPNMFAKVTIYGGAKSGIVIIPRQALIRTGQEQRVILDQGDGHFGPRNVKAGIETGDKVEIIEGLRGGEKVVVSGHFLIDSEASLKASLMRMKDKDAKDPERMIMGTGVIKKVMLQENKLNMAHDPIPAIGWPSMVMDFRFKDGIDVSNLQDGDKVEFHLEEGKDGYVVSDIKKINP